MLVQVVNLKRLLKVVLLLEETVLPGLGVLFETYYNSLSSKDELLDSLSHLLK